MSTEGIIGIVITLIVGLPSLKAIFNINKTQIVYLEKQLINLRDDLLKNFEDLSIKYKGVEVKKNIYFISGFFVCQGKKDISSTGNKINLILPESWKWLDLKIVSTSKGMSVSREFIEKKVSLSFDLFKTKEFIEYEGIIEIDEEIKKEQISKLLEFHHRIPNISKIKKFNIENLKSGGALLIVSLFFFLISFLIAYEYNTINELELNTFNAETNEEISTISYENIENLRKKIANERSGIILLIEERTEIFPVKEYDVFSRTTINSVYFKLDDWETEDSITSVIFVAFFILSILLIIASIQVIYYRKKYLKLIKN